jgi:hypothetical protein
LLAQLREAGFRDVRAEQLLPFDAFVAFTATNGPGGG